jgi:hypothetical protein
VAGVHAAGDRRASRTRSRALTCALRNLRGCRASQRRRVARRDGDSHTASLRGTTKRPFAVDSRWWRGRADITTFEIEELLATKLRALLQRKKARDLFDLWTALEEGIDPSAVVDIFSVYVKQRGHTITRALFEENLADKIHLPAFTEDIPPLLPPGVTFDLGKGIERVLREMIARMPGEPWKGKPKREARRRPSQKE